MAYYNSKPILGHCREHKRFKTHNDLDMSYIDDYKRYYLNDYEDDDEYNTNFSFDERNILLNSQRVTKNLIETILANHKTIPSNKPQNSVAENKSYKDISNLVEFIPYNVILENFENIEKKGNNLLKIPPKAISKFEENSFYSIQKFDEDIPMEKQIFQLIKILKPNDLITNDTLVMKLVDGPNNGIYSLTKLDCKLIGIPYESGLQLFSPELKWIKEDKDKKTNENQIFYFDNGEMHIFFKIKEIIVNNRTFVKVNDSTLCDLGKFISLIEVYYNRRKILFEMMLNDINEEPLLSEMILHCRFKMDDVINIHELKTLSVKLNTSIFKDIHYERWENSVF